jgi:hypothetical protein
MYDKLNVINNQTPLNRLNVKLFRLNIKQIVNLLLKNYDIVITLKFQKR